MGVRTGVKDPPGCRRPGLEHRLQKDPPYGVVAISLAECTTVWLSLPGGWGRLKTNVPSSFLSLPSQVGDGTWSQFAHVCQGMAWDVHQPIHSREETDSPTLLPPAPPSDRSHRVMIGPSLPLKVPGFLPTAKSVSLFTRELNAN